MRLYPKVSGLAAWSENCKWYVSLPLGAAVSLFCESTLYVASQRVFIVVAYFVIDSVRKILDTPSYICLLYWIRLLTLQFPLYGL
jgi:hypothetical protein